MKRLIWLLIAVVLCVNVTAVFGAEAETEKEKAFLTEELILKNGEQDIYGMMLVPNTDQETYPVIILSHGFGGNYRGMQSIGQFFARAGYAAYVYDFIGGSTTSKSGDADGDMTEMSVLTEASDLSAVIDQIKQLSYIDAEHLFLLGQSQGGYVSAYVAAQQPEDVRALVLMYPAFVIGDDCRERYASIEEIPVVEEYMGQTIGRIYSADAMSVDIYEEIGKYSGDVLICHGDNDQMVDLSYSEHAAEVYENAQLHVYEGAGHGFGGALLKQFEEEALEFFNRHLE